jgi:hypothetical protein
MGDRRCVAISPLILLVASGAILRGIGCGCQHQRRGLIWKLTTSIESNRLAAIGLAGQNAKLKESSQAWVFRWRIGRSLWMYIKL